MENKRIFYKVDSVYLNGIRVSGLRDVDVTTTFELTACFCSCSVMLNAQYENCPNAKGKIIRYL